MPGWQAAGQGCSWRCRIGPVEKRYWRRRRPVTGVFCRGASTCTHWDKSSRMGC